MSNNPLFEVKERVMIDMATQHLACTMATKTPPEFVLNFSSLTLLSAEEIRLAKRDTDSPQLVCSFVALSLIFPLGYCPRKLSSEVM